MRRAHEIAQGLRHESGCLTFPLDVLDYNQGAVDFEAGTPPPRVTSPSYDLGRARALEKREKHEQFLDWQRQEDIRREATMRDLLKDHPEALSDYLAKIADIRAKQ